MKKIYFLIVVSLQFSLFAFSQSDSIHRYTDSEITKLSDYIKNLEKRTPAANLDVNEQKQIADLLATPSHAYTDMEVIKLNDYIRGLEKINSVASLPSARPTTPSNDSLHTYTDAEITKLSNHITDLEKRVSAVNASELNPVDQQQIVALLANPSHKYTDAQVIKLANYIKYLTKLESLNTAVAIAKVTEPEKDINKPIGPLKEVHLEEEKDIDKYERLIFFDFNKATLKEESYTPLDDVIKILKSYVSFNFAVEGYCDSVGSDAYNLSLSQRRAGAVKSYFISKGIPASRVSSKGFGEAYPIAPNRTEEGRAKNRRVAIAAKKK